MDSSFFVVVNTNDETHNPGTGEPFSGNLCFRNGYQTKNLSEASIYWKQGNAQNLANRLNKGLVDKEYKKHYNLHFPNNIVDGQYVVREYTVVEVK